MRIEPDDRHAAIEKVRFGQRARSDGPASPIYVSLAAAPAVVASAWSGGLRPLRCARRKRGARRRQADRYYSAQCLACRKPDRRFGARRRGFWTPLARECQGPIDCARLRKHIASVVAAIAPNYAQARLEAMNVKIIRAEGHFTRPDTCEASNKIIMARRFVVATGAVENTLPIPGLDLVRPLDCASLCALEQLPRSLIVIGADPDGLALAQAMRRFGCGVIVLANPEFSRRKMKNLPHRCAPSSPAMASSFMRA